MNLRIFTLIVNLLVIVSLQAQSGEAFELAVINDQNHDYSFGGDYTSDSAIIVAGYTDITNQSDIALVQKIDIYGNVIWRKNLSTGSSHSRFYNCRRLVDGNFLLVGRAGNDHDALIYKIDEDGNELFSYQLEGGGEEQLIGIAALPDSGFLASGFTSSNGDQTNGMLIVRFDKNGQIVWNKNLNGIEQEFAQDLIVFGNRIYITGHESVNSGAEVNGMLTKMTLDGEVLFSKTFGQPNDICYSSRIVPLASGNLLMGTRTTINTNGGEDVNMMIADSSTGEFLYANALGGSGNERSNGVYIFNGHYYCSGYTNSFGNGQERYIARISEKARTMWVKIIGGGSDDEANNGTPLIKDAWGSFVMLGHTKSFGSPNLYNTHIVRLDTAFTISCKTQDVPFGFKNMLPTLLVEDYSYTEFSPSFSISSSSLEETNIAYTTTIQCQRDITPEIQVWPGDCNNDGTVDNFDIFPIGIANTSTGPSRANASSSWMAQGAESFGIVKVFGQDIAHADANGDGVVNKQDLLVVRQNYNLTHNRSVDTLRDYVWDSVPLLFTLEGPSILQEGSGLEVKVTLGDSQNILDKIYGFSIKLDYNETAVSFSPFQLNTESSFLGEEGLNLESFVIEDEDNAYLDMVVTKNNHVDEEGYGEVFTFTSVIESIHSYSGHVIPFSNVIAEMVTYDGDTLRTTLQNEFAFYVGQSEINTVNDWMKIYPNPSTGSFNIILGKSVLEEESFIEVYNIHGAIVKSIPVLEQRIQLDLDLDNGMYFIHLNLKGNKSALVQKVHVSR